MPGLTPFVYPEIRQPFAGSIADLMLRKGDIAATALRQATQDATAPIARAADPAVQLQQQQLDANKRALQYQQTATKMAQSLVGPNGEQPTPEDASSLMTKSGIPVEYQQPILKSLGDIQNRHKENYADIAHAAYRTLNALPPEATDEDRRHAVAGTLGAFSAFGGVSQDDITHVTQALAAGHDPRSLAIAFMGQSPTSRYKDIIQDETKPQFAPRQSPGYFQGGEFHKTDVPTEAKAEANVVYRTPDGVEHPVTVKDGKYWYGPQDVTEKVTRPAPTKERSEREQALDAYAKSLGVVDAQGNGAGSKLTDAQRLAYDKRQAGVASDKALAQHVAERNYDIAHPEPAKAKSQDDLEQEYRGLIQREFSSRSGGMGMEDGKVDAATHLLTLLDQTEGKPMSAQLHAELAMGLAKLTSPNGTVGIEMEKEFKQKTAQEGIAKAAAWLTGDPNLVNATPDKLREMYRDSIERQGAQAQRNRQAYFDGIKAAAPTTLEASRKQALEGALKLVRMPNPKGAPASGTQKNGATWKDGDQGWGWYR